MTTLKNSTALVLALTLAIPQNAIAQQNALDLSELTKKARKQVEKCIEETGDATTCYTDILTKQLEKQQKKEADAQAEVAPEASEDAAEAADPPEQPEITADNETPEASATAEAEAEAGVAPAEQDAPAEMTEDSSDQGEKTQKNQLTKEERQARKEERQARKEARRAEAEAALEKSLAAEEDGAAPAAAALADADETDMEGATEETITQDTARSSDEDFNTRVSQKSNDDDEAEDEGMSTVEKAALAGLAALAVGAILKNGSQVAANSGDRVVLEQPDGSYRVIKDDGALLRQPGTTMRTQTYDDGSSRTISTREDGAQIITIYDSQKRIVRRERVEPNGDRYVLVDDSREVAPVEVTQLPEADVNDSITTDDQDALRAALAQQAQTDRSFSLNQIRQISQVRALAPSVAVENVTFASGSAAIRPEQAEALSELGTAIRERIADNPREIFLVEGHTDAVGNGAFNLALSDRRAESLALALTEYFDVPPENLVVQGYGEEYLKVETLEAEERNRRATVRRITDLLRTAQAD